MGVILQFQGGDVMTDFKEMYIMLFRSMTAAIDILEKAQTETERMYVEAEPPKLTVFPTEETEKNSD